MPVIDIDISPIETLEEFREFSSWAVDTARTEEIEDPASIDLDPNRSQERCIPYQAHALFYCCWNRIDAYNLSLIAARQIPQFCRQDNKIVNLLCEVAAERLEYRRTHPGLDFHEHVITKVIEMKLDVLWDYRERRRGRYANAVASVMLRRNILSLEQDRALRNAMNL